MANKKEIIDKHVTRKKTSWLIRDVLQGIKPVSVWLEADYNTDALCNQVIITRNILRVTCKGYMARTKRKKKRTEGSWSIGSCRIKDMISRVPVNRRRRPDWWSALGHTTALEVHSRRLVMRVIVSCCRYNWWESLATAIAGAGCCRCLRLLQQAPIITVSIHADCWITLAAHDLPSILCRLVEADHSLMLGLSILILLQQAGRWRECCSRSRFITAQISYCHRCFCCRRQAPCCCCRRQSPCFCYRQ